jgi:hypothetical protein
MPLRKPTPTYVRRRLNTYIRDRYYSADPAIDLVFDRWPENSDRPQVLAKVTVLNALYGTRIFDVYPVVDRILSLKLDDRLRSGDETIVDDVAHVKLGGRTRVLLSFASKYCAWHQPKQFQIFDSRVVRTLCEYRKAYSFGGFTRYGLRDYPTFARVIGQFRNFFGLNHFTRKEIDKFLWLEGAP